MPKSETRFDINFLLFQFVKAYYLPFINDLACLEIMFCQP